MKTTPLIYIEKIDSAPFSYGANELDHALKPALNDYLKNDELRGIKNISKHFCLLITYLTKSFYYKKENREIDVEHEIYEVVNCKCGHKCPIEFAKQDGDGNWICPNCL